MIKSDYDIIKNKDNDQKSSFVHVAPSPHVSSTSFNTRSMMVDVLIALLPVVAMSVYIFKWFAIKQLLICLITCLLAEMLFVSLRRKPFSLNDSNHHS